MHLSKASVMKLSAASSRFLELHCRIWKSNAAAVSEDHWLVCIWNIRMHDCVIPEFLSDALETLKVRFAPYDITHFLALNLPSSEPAEHTTRAQSLLVRNKI